MVLVKKDIVELIRAGEVIFEPALDKFQLQPHSVDLRLGYTFLVPKMWKMTVEGREAVKVDHLRMKEGNRKYFDVVELEEGQYFDLLPREHIIVASLEKVKLSAGLMAVLYTAIVTGKQEIL